MKKITKQKIKKWVQFFTNPRLLLCIAIAWMITNGWSYIALAIGSYFKINWLIAVSGTYIAFLWLPISPEKIITLAISIFLLKRLFPNDTKTLLVLKGLREKACEMIKKRKSKKKDRYTDIK